MKKKLIINNILVEKLVFWWKWFAKLSNISDDLNWKILFITWWAVPWQIVNVKILKKKTSYLDWQIIDIVKRSSIEKNNENNIYWECWWCKWINIDYKEQLKIKEQQIKESFLNIQKIQKNIIIEDIVASSVIYWYRNKIEFSFWKYISKKDNIQENFNVWFHKQWEFSKIQDFDWCILIDENQNKIYKEIKDFSKTTWLEAYDHISQKWFYRHILIRKAYFTNEIMILLSFNNTYFKQKEEEKKYIEILKKYFFELAKKYEQIKSIYFSYNNNKFDSYIWDLKLIYWKSSIKEKINWLYFNISASSFFQTNSIWAQKLYSLVLECIDNIDELKNATVLDLYWWTWTIWIIFAKSWAKEVISVELVASASKDWEENAKLNNINNIKFYNKKVEDFLWEYISKWNTADILIIDPPRTWMHQRALTDILKFDTKQIIYISCNPSTLSRDLEYILKNSNYKINKIKPIDMFPHTHHIELIVSLKKKY